jgi:hypothetical protein
MKANTYLHRFHEELLDYQQSRSGLEHCGIQHTARFLKDHGQIGEEHYLVIECLLKHPEAVPDRHSAFKKLTIGKLSKIITGG